MFFFSMVTSVRTEILSQDIIYNLLHVPGLCLHELYHLSIVIAVCNTLLFNLTKGHFRHISVLASIFENL